MLAQHLRVHLRVATTVALLAVPAAIAAQEQSTSTGTVVIRAARLIDGTGAPEVRNGVVVVSGDSIVGVGKEGNVAIPAGARVIDLGDATILPGFVDAHTHIIGRVLGDPAWDQASVKDYSGYGAILGVGNAQRTLMAGFTTIRVVGSPNFDDIALRQAITEGRVVGPRMQNAGHAIGMTGGHCDENGYRPGLMDGDIKTGIADGPEQVRAAVRYQVKYGADVIKTCATGGVLSEGDAVGATQYSYEELRALVEEANKLDRKVAAHAHGTEGIKLATRAGVSSIEHGSFLDEDGAKLMAQRGTFLVPTLMAGEASERAAKTGVLKGLRAQKALAAAAAQRKAIKLAIANKVPIALGTDAGVIQHGTNGHEFTLMVEWGGMRPMDAIVAGTMGGAKLLGWDKHIGSLTAGKWADVVAVRGDPLTDIRRLESAIFVMKNGVVYRSPAQTTAQIP
jgi:imidazolonepropionase-like amidohydrolase